ncbi:hypothetical protein COCVIDRAFT_109224 [Bipolaris victoriae FI3]|uniref:Uncharacterized protein n=1 Tax=Bipolaris victoriae (strain FI3) TaxID=930091 RepID=W7EGC7_BIPV3|nr:hypothetical protein COCVIDRAFT_109224 [Bipolaris victoriae FI3]
MSQSILVIVGAGGIGEAIARRVGPGKEVLLGDRSNTLLQDVTQRMKRDGFRVTPQHVDISSRDSVIQFAKTAQSLGQVMHVAVSAGLSPVSSTRETILGVNLAGTGFCIAEFGKLIGHGGTCVVISSLAGYTLAQDVPHEVIQQLARTSPSDVLGSPLLRETVLDQWSAYGVSKRVNYVQVQDASLSWARHGARINSISPGAIQTPMLSLESQASKKDVAHDLAQNIPCKRVGSSGEVAHVAAFLLGSESSFVTGTDVLVDGGALAYLSRDNSSS